MDLSLKEVRWFGMIDKPNLEVEIAGIKLKNPVMTASGTFGYGQEYDLFVDLNRLGAIILKGITLKPKRGNPPPRIIETPSGMLNAIGLQNVGVEAFTHLQAHETRHDLVCRLLLEKKKKERL